MMYVISKFVVNGCLSIIISIYLNIIRTDVIQVLYKY